MARLDNAVITPKIGASMTPNKLRAFKSGLLALIVTFVGLLLPRCLTATEAEDVSMRVMTFNIRYDNPNDGENAWPHRKDVVARVIGQHADIAGLQEVTFQQLKDLGDRLPDFETYGVGREDGKNQGEFSPILYRRDRFEIVSGETFWLSETPKVPGSRSWDSAITRIVTVAKMRERASGAHFYFLNTHFDHRGAVARTKSAGMIREKLTQLDSMLPVVVTGDFNCTPDQEPYRIMIERGEADPPRSLFDARDKSKTKPTGPDSTWNGFREIVPGRRIDFIFVSPTVKVTGHQTLDARSSGRFPSDHLAVVADVQIEK
jgi:endonuclease/exonuclease/phosphatase family metal-dependent hydrolase